MLLFQDSWDWHPFKILILKRFQNVILKPFQCSDPESVSRFISWKCSSLKILILKLFQNPETVCSSFKILETDTGRWQVKSECGLEAEFDAVGHKLYYFNFLHKLYFCWLLSFLMAIISLDPNWMWTAGWRWWWRRQCHRFSSLVEEFMPGFTSNPSSSNNLRRLSLNSNPDPVYFVPLSLQKAIPKVFKNFCPHPKLVYVWPFLSHPSV